MMRRAIFLGLLCLGSMAAATSAPATARAAGEGQPADWQRFYYYPYVYYPQNFERPVQFDHMYYRYPEERRIPVYNRAWYNFYPTAKPYHWGSHFKLDVF